MLDRKGSDVDFLQVDIPSGRPNAEGFDPDAPETDRLTGGRGGQLNYSDISTPAQVSYDGNNDQSRDSLIPSKL